MTKLNVKKQLIFDKLSASETIANGGLPLLKKGYDAYNNKSDSPIDFLISLFRRTVGIDKLVDVLNNIIYSKLSMIETTVKSNIYLNIDNLITCSISQNLYKELYDQGIDIRLDLIDYMGLLKINPNSEEGRLLYGINNDDENDLNVVLYQALTDVGVTKSWYSILDITFFNDNNVSDFNEIFRFNIKINNTYGRIKKENDEYEYTKTLKNLTEDIINNITLFNKKNVISRLIDNIFNNITSNIKKTNEQLLFEEKINNLLDKIIHTDTENEFSIIDDSFFTFSNTQYDEMLKRTHERKQNKFKTDLNVEIDPYLTITQLDELLNNINDDITLVEQQTIIDNIISNSIDNSNIENDSKESLRIKNNMIERMIRELTLIITNTIISPKVMLVYLYNFKILNLLGNNIKKDDIITIMLKQIEPIITNIKNEIINYISDYIISYVKNLASEMAKKWAVEITKSTKQTIKSLKPW